MFFTHQNRPHSFLSLAILAVDGAHVVHFGCLVCSRSPDFLAHFEASECLGKLICALWLEFSFLVGLSHFSI
jgi:hypothetical protein